MKIGEVRSTIHSINNELGKINKFIVEAEKWNFWNEKKIFKIKFLYKLRNSNAIHYLNKM